MDSRSERLGNGKYGSQKADGTEEWAAGSADPRCMKRSGHHGERYRKEHSGQALHGPVLEAYIISLVERSVSDYPTGSLPARYRLAILTPQL